MSNTESEGNLVKVPRGTTLFGQPPPGPRIIVGRGSRPWQHWARASHRLEAEAVALVVSHVVDGKFVQLLIDGQILTAHSGTVKPYNAPSIICPHCHFSGTGKSQMARWHFDNCKYK